MLDWQVTRRRILLQKLLHSYQYLTWLFLIRISTHSYVLRPGTKTVAITWEFWNSGQAAGDWAKGECYELVPPIWDIIHRLRIGHIYLMHRHLQRGETLPRCSDCQVELTVVHILLHCVSFTNARDDFFHVTVTSSELFLKVASHSIDFIKETGFIIKF